jgi:hypothetical protein
MPFPSFPCKSPSHLGPRALIAGAIGRTQRAPECHFPGNDRRTHSALLLLFLSLPPPLAAVDALNSAISASSRRPSPRRAPINSAERRSTSSNLSTLIAADVCLVTRRRRRRRRRRRSPTFIPSFIKRLLPLYLSKLQPRRRLGFHSVAGEPILDLRVVHSGRVY